jgi:hypothetical protein
VLIPYHVKVSLEGLPHHAWSIEMAERVLRDEAVIHHVEQATRRREDFRFYSCWAFSQYPSRIPQVVYLTLTDRLGDPDLMSSGLSHPLLYWCSCIAYFEGVLNMASVHSHAVSDKHNLRKLQY